MSGTLSVIGRAMRVATEASQAPAASYSTARSPLERTRDARECHATPRLGGFLALAAQLAGLLLVFHLYHLEKPKFVLMSAAVFAAFLVHYWLPFRFKE